MNAPRCPGGQRQDRAVSTRGLTRPFERRCAQVAGAQQCGYLVRPDRPAAIEALVFVATHRVKLPELLRRLDTLGSHLQVKDSLATRSGPMFCAARKSTLRIRLGQAKNTNGNVSIR